MATNEQLLPKAFSNYFILLRESARRDGWVVAVVLAVLGALASPIDLASKLVTGGTRNIHRIDLFHCLRFACTTAILAFAPATWWPLLVVWPATCIADKLYWFIRALAFVVKPPSRPRAVILDLLHFTEIILLFACVYVFMQSHAATPLFVRNGQPADLTRPQLAFFSFITAATIGFGDIVPNHAAPPKYAYLLYGLTFLKTVSVLTLTLAEFARVMSAVPDKPAA